MCSTTEILGEHFVSDATVAAALEELGAQGVVDLIGRLGNFSMLAMAGCRGARARIT